MFNFTTLEFHVFRIMHHDQLGYCLENIFKVCTLFNVTTLMKSMLCLSGDHALCRSCRQCVMYLLCLSGDHALCGSCRQCVMYCCFCLATMLRAGLVDSVSCNVVSVWRPCFVRVLSTVYHVLLCLSGDHALCGSCRQCVIYCCVCLTTMLCGCLVDSVSCNVVSVWRFLSCVSSIYL